MVTSGSVTRALKKERQNAASPGTRLPAALEETPWPSNEIIPAKPPTSTHRSTIHEQMRNLVQPSADEGSSYTLSPNESVLRETVADEEGRRIQDTIFEGRLERILGKPASDSLKMILASRNEEMGYTYRQGNGQIVYFNGNSLPASVSDGRYAERLLVANLTRNEMVYLRTAKETDAIHLFLVGDHEAFGSFHGEERGMQNWKTLTRAAMEGAVDRLYHFWAFERLFASFDFSLDLMLVARWLLCLRFSLGNNLEDSYGLLLSLSHETPPVEAFQSDTLLKVVHGPHLPLQQQYDVNSDIQRGVGSSSTIYTDSKTVARHDSRADLTNKDLLVGQCQVPGGNNELYVTMPDLVFHKQEVHMSRDDFFCGYVGCETGKDHIENGFPGPWSHAGNEPNDLSVSVSEHASVSEMAEDSRTIEDGSKDAPNSHSGVGFDSLELNDVHRRYLAEALSSGAFQDVHSRYRGYCANKNIESCSLFDFRIQAEIIRRELGFVGDLYECDYANCVNLFPFTRKEDYTDHLRDSHCEDIGMPPPSTPGYELLLAIRKTSPEWWRCRLCFRRIKIDDNGWKCHNCQQFCERERIIFILGAKGGPSDPRFPFLAKAMWQCEENQSYRSPKYLSNFQEGDMITVFAETVILFIGEYTDASGAKYVGIIPPGYIDRTTFDEELRLALADPNNQADVTMPPISPQLDTYRKPTPLLASKPSLLLQSTLNEKIKQKGNYVDGNGWATKVSADANKRVVGNRQDKPRQTHADITQREPAQVQLEPRYSHQQSQEAKAAAPAEEDSALEYKVPVPDLPAYFFFEEIRDENPGISFDEISKILDERWMALNDQQRAPYEAKAALDKKRYELEKSQARAQEEPNSHSSTASVPTLLATVHHSDPSDKRSKSKVISRSEQPLTILPPRDRSLPVGQDYNSNSSSISVSSSAVTPIQQNTSAQHAEEVTTAMEFSHTEYLSYKLVPLTSIKQLGHGSLGSVDAVRRNDDDSGTILARKVILLRNMARKRLLPLIQQEVAVLRGLEHKHIVKVISTYETTSVPRQFGILLSPAGEEDLSHYLERVGESDFPKDDLRRLKSWPYCLTSAVAHIHSQSIRHKDIKPSNIICNGDEVFLTDFGSAHEFSAGLTSSTEGYVVGITRMYSAPEVIAQDRRGRPADIYSLGCVFAEMSTVANGRRIEDFQDFRSEPVPDEPDRMTLCYYATAHKMDEWFAGQDDQWTFSLISKMMAEDQKLRPSAKDILMTMVEHSGRPCCSCSSLVSDHSINVQEMPSLKYIPKDQRGQTRLS